MLIVNPPNTSTWRPLPPKRLPHIAMPPESMTINGKLVEAKITYNKQFILTLASAIARDSGGSSTRDIVIDHVFKDAASDEKEFGRNKIEDFFGELFLERKLVHVGCGRFSLP